MEDLDAAVVNTDWALKSGLTPDNRIAQEPVADNPYRNFIAVREESQGRSPGQAAGRSLSERRREG